MSSIRDTFDEFHNEISDDLYDLYNIANGAIYEGKLDTRRLDDLDPDEQEIFDVPRLKRLAAHLQGGCVSCEAIINTLTAARKALSRRVAREAAYGRQASGGEAAGGSADSAAPGKRARER
jgi:hypothetical protein